LRKKKRKFSKKRGFVFLRVTRALALVASKRNACTKKKKRQREKAKGRIKKGRLREQEGKS